MIMSFKSLPRSGLPATEATRLAWECLASAGQFGYDSFSCPCQKQTNNTPPPKTNKPGCINLRAQRDLASEGWHRLDQ